MADIQETPLPGVGVRFDFATASGDHLGMIVHRTGRRELLLYDRDDPDRCRQVVSLEDEDIRTLGDVLGVPRVTEHMETLQQSVEGLVIDWFRVEEGAACASHTIRETELRSRTGTTIVAVVRDGKTIPSPDPQFELVPGDVAVMIGTPESIQTAFALLRRS